MFKAGSKEHKVNEGNFFAYSPPTPEEKLVGLIALQTFRDKEEKRPFKSY